MIRIPDFPSASLSKNQASGYCDTCEVTPARVVSNADGWFLFPADVASAKMGPLSRWSFEGIEMYWDVLDGIIS